MATFLPGATFDKALTNALGTTPEINMTDAVNGAIRFPSGYASSEVEIYGAEASGGTFEKIYDKLATQVKMFVSASLPAKTSMPPETFDWPFIKFVTNNAADNAVNVTFSIRF